MDFIKNAMTVHHILDGVPLLATAQYWAERPWATLWYFPSVLGLSGLYFWPRLMLYSQTYGPDEKVCLTSPIDVSTTHPGTCSWPKMSLLHFKEKSTNRFLLDEKVHSFLLCLLLRTGASLRTELLIEVPIWSYSHCRVEHCSLPAYKHNVCINLLRWSKINPCQQGQNSKSQSGYMQRH